MFFCKSPCDLLFWSILNMKKYFPSWVFLCIYPLFHWRDVVRSWRFRKDKRGVGCLYKEGDLNQPSEHYIPSQSGFRRFWIKVSQEGIYWHHFYYIHADRDLKNKETDKLLMFDAKIGKPKFFKNFPRWLLISFDLWILLISVLKNLLVLTLQMR